MTSPHAYFALSFVFLVLFFSQHCVGSRVSQLQCFAEGVASVWFQCEWFYVCDQIGAAPLFEVCPPQHTFDLGSRRCLCVKHLHEMDTEMDVLSCDESEGVRRFPCRPFEGTDEKYWFQILKSVNNTAEGGGNSSRHVHEEWLQPPEKLESGRPVPGDWLRPPKELSSGRPVPGDWLRPPKELLSGRALHPEKMWPTQDRHRYTESPEWDYTTPHHDRYTDHPEYDWSTPRHDRHTESPVWDWPTPQYDSGHTEQPHGAEYIPTADML